MSQLRFSTFHYKQYNINMDELNCKDLVKPTIASAAGTLSTSDGDDSESDWMETENEALQPLSDTPQTHCVESSCKDMETDRVVDCDEEFERKESVQGMRRKVSWGNIEMHLHPVIPGDHPDTIEGPPVGEIAER